MDSASESVPSGTPTLRLMANLIRYTGGLVCGGSPSPVVYNWAKGGLSVSITRDQAALTARILCRDTMYHSWYK